MNAECEICLEHYLAKTTKFCAMLFNRHVIE